jgi:non-heme chloroperoxidase
MSTITVKDGTTIYYKDWGKGPVVTFSHGWPLSSDAWAAMADPAKLGPGTT